jgi:hypothetical protein
MSFAPTVLVVDDSPDGRETRDRLENPLSVGHFHLEH